MKLKILGITLLVVFTHTISVAADLDDSLKTIGSTNKSGANSQKKIDGLSRETQVLLNKYKKLLHNTEYQEAYNQELQSLKEEQEKELDKLEQQVNNIKVTQQRIMPLMHGMAETLEQFILLDLPFHQEQRLSSVLVLKQQLKSARISTPAKLRSVWEAFQIENDYGYSIESYRSSLKRNGDKISVDFLRIGRIALYFQTIDGKESAYWDKSSKQWQTLPSEFNSDIKQSLRVAEKQLAPQLLNLPLTSFNLPSSKGGK